MNPNLIGLYVGAAASLVFLAVSFFYYKKVPSLNQVAVVLLAWAGAVVGGHLGYFAVVWTAAESFFTSLRAIKA
jgi:hypothetical protein